MADMTLEEALAAADVEERDTAVNDVITIDPETRKIIVPDSETTFGVETDKDVERKYFRCPRIVGDNIDLYAHKIYIVYVTAKDVNGTFLPDLVKGKYWCEDVAVDGDCITFSWVLSENVLSKAGIIAFKILAVTTDGDKEKTRWNTAPAYGTILMTVHDGDNIEERYPDIVTQLLERMDAVEAIATEEAINGYVAEYMENHPVVAGATAEQAAQIEQNKNDVTQLKGDIGQLSDDIDNKEEAGTAESKVSAHNTSTDAHNDIRLLIQNLVNTVTTLLDSDDETLDQTSEIVAYIKSNKSLIDAITTSKVSVTDIIDNLTTNVANKPLSASQGVALKETIDALRTELDGVVIPAKLPNPNSLKIVYGGQEFNYDGSEVKEIVIDSASIDEGELNTMLQEVLV